MPRKGKRNVGDVTRYEWAAYSRLHKEVENGCPVDRKSIEIAANHRRAECRERETDSNENDDECFRVLFGIPSKAANSMFEHGPHGQLL
jgi:hypothetical protein